MNDVGFFRAGTRVWFRGVYATQYSIRGVVEEVMPHVDAGRIVGVDRYGVRLENGNYKLCAPNQVRERGDH